MLLPSNRRCYRQAAASRFRHEVPLIQAQRELPGRPHQSSGGPEVPADWSGTEGLIEAAGPGCVDRPSSCGGGSDGVALVVCGAAVGIAEDRVDGEELLERRIGCGVVWLVTGSTGVGMVPAEQAA